MKNYQKIKNQRDNENIVCDGYIYNKDNRKNKVGWRCFNRKCNSIGQIDENDIFSCSSHNHNSDEAKTKRLLVMRNIKAESLNSAKSNPQIITENTKNLDEVSIKGLPLYKTMIDAVTRLRSKKYVAYDRDLNDIPTIYHNDLTKSKFLQFDLGAKSEKRFIIFCSEYNMLYLKEAQTCLIDGTFWSVPSNFLQLVTISVYLFGRFFPMAYILLKDKSEESYTNAFNKIKLLSQCDFKNIIIDFEQALKNSLESIFNNSKIHGCNFHFGQSVLRKVQKINLFSDYINDIDTKNVIRNFLNLAFVPKEFVIENFKNLILITREKYKTKFDNFIEYFNKTYIGLNIIQPLYRISFWNANKRIKENIPRTTNCLEAWHRSINFNCNVSHPNFAKFIEVLIQENEKVRVCLIQSRSQIRIGNRNLLKEEKLRQIVLNYCFYKDNEFFENLLQIVGWTFIEK